MGLMPPGDSRTSRWWRMPRVLMLALLAAAGYTLACGSRDATTRLTFSGSALGAEGDLVRRQLARFAERHPGLRVDLQVTPDSADQRHQLYVQWLNARAPTPDILQLDVVWMAEFAAAGWILPLDAFQPRVDDFLPAALAAARWNGALHAIPWFVDVGLLYWRTDLLDRPPASLVELRETALRLRESDSTRFGLVWQGARYEGLITVFLEHLSAFGGGILDASGRVIVDEPAAIRALTFMANAVNVDRVVPSSALTWQEEQVRFAFQNGEAAFMRNWPYAWALLQDESRSRVARRFAVASFPAAEGGRPAAALGGAQLAINAESAYRAPAFELVAFLTAPEQMIERARLAAQLPPRRSLYEDPALAAALPIPIDQIRGVLEAAVPRPATPVYSELSEILQVRIHRALTQQQRPAAALQEAAREIRALLTRAGLSTEAPAP